MSHVGGEPAASWTCPDCGHDWISATKPSGSSESWRCSCGHDTKRATKRRANQRAQRARLAARETA